MFNSTLPEHLCVEIKLVKKEDTFNDLGTLVEGVETQEIIKGTFQYIEKEVLIRTYGIDIESKVYKLVCREILEVRDVITYSNERFEVIEARKSIYTDANIYLVKNIRGGEYV